MNKKNKIYGSNENNHNSSANYNNPHLPVHERYHLLPNPRLPSETYRREMMKSVLSFSSSFMPPDLIPAKKYSLRNIGCSPPRQPKQQLKVYTNQGQPDEQNCNNQLVNIRTKDRIIMSRSVVRSRFQKGDGKDRYKSSKVSQRLMSVWTRNKNKAGGILDFPPRGSSIIHSIGSLSEKKRVRDSRIEFQLRGSQQQRRLVKAADQVTSKELKKMARMKSQPEHSRRNIMRATSVSPLRHPMGTKVSLRPDELQQTQQLLVYDNSVSKLPLSPHDSSPPKDPSPQPLNNVSIRISSKEISIPSHRDFMCSPWDYGSSTELNPDYDP